MRKSTSDPTLTRLDWDDLRFVLAVAEGGSVAAASRMLAIAQSAVTKSMQELEDELGIELFVRAGRRLLGLTPPGQAMLPIIERLLQAA